jgi:MFS family permease
VLINAFVRGMVGLQSTVVPLIGAQEFRIASATTVLSFIISLGVIKAVANLVSGHFADIYGRKHMLVLGWLIGLPVPFMIAWGPSIGDGGDQRRINQAAGSGGAITPHAETPGQQEAQSACKFAPPDIAEPVLAGHCG